MAMGDTGIPYYENEGGKEDEKEGAMPTSEPPRGFHEPDSRMDLQYSESDFYIPDDTERLTRPTKQQTVRKIEEIARKIDTNPETTQYLLIVNPDDTLRTYLLNNRIGGVRLTFDDYNILLRIMPSLLYEGVVGDFSLLFAEAMTAVGLPRSGNRWRGTAAAQRKGIYCEKEPDFSIVPFQSLSTWPSLVVEVGMSQSHRSLRMDAEWWFENSNKTTRLILLFKIHKNPFWVDIELWSAPYSPRPGLPTRQSTTLDPDHPTQFKPGEALLSVTQALRVTKGEVTLVKGSSLDISLNYEQLMREDRPAGQADVVITQRILQMICEEFH